ncbi:MAG: DUF4911 domain-containing protein [Desulfosarcina sp.]|nr:DUF4911 domain-containing protein [Desulfobacterales bacterium]
MDTPDADDIHRSDGPLRTSQRFYRIERRDISYLRFILEAYDGMAVLTTKDAARGIVVITIAPGSEVLVDEVVTSLSQEGEIFIEPMPAENLTACFKGRACVSSL